MSTVAIPILADYLGMGADIPPRLGVQTIREHNNLSTRVRFTPAVNGGILSLKEDSRTANRRRVGLKGAGRSTGPRGCKHASGASARSDPRTIERSGAFKLFAERLRVATVVQP